MTQTSVAENIVSALLSWLKALANWVLKLFNLAGSGASPLLWLSQNWIFVLGVLLVFGVGMDLLVWLVRWRPYWVWFHKKRIVVNDERLFKPINGESDHGLEQRYTVKSQLVKPLEKKQPPKPEPIPRRRVVDTSMRRRTTVRPVRIRPEEPVRSKEKDIFDTNMFDVRRGKEGFSDFYEDEVFNLSNLPKARKTQKRPKE